MQTNFALRMWIAALAGALASLVLKGFDTLRPGVPQSVVLASKHVPFFQHMLVCGWIAALAFFAAPALSTRLPLRPKPAFIVIALAAVAAGALQWFYPNY